MRNTAPELLLNRYQILEKIGGGGFAEVFRAYDTRMGRSVAIKKIRASAKTATRAIREAQTTALLNHPNIVTLHEFEESSDFYYLIMEFIEGKTLSEELEEHAPLDLRLALDIVYQMTAALEWAHMNGVIHRDIKPDNIMILENGQVKVMDFGTARLKDSSLTREGGLIGTLNYMSPEQVEGKPADEASDLFALATVFYEMITGTNPYQAASAGSTLYKILNTTPKLASEVNPAVPEAIDAIIRQAQARPRDYQEQSVADFRSALEEATGFKKNLPRLIKDWVTETPPHDEGPTRLWHLIVQRGLVAVIAAGIGLFITGGTASLTEFVLAFATAIFVMTLIKPLWSLAVLTAVGAVIAGGVSVNGAILLIIGSLALALVFRKETTAIFWALMTPALSMLQVGLAAPFVSGFLYRPAMAGLTAGIGCVVAEIWLLLRPGAAVGLFPLVPEGALASDFTGAPSLIAAVTILLRPFLTNAYLLYQPILWAAIATGLSILYEKKHAPLQIVAMLGAGSLMFLGYAWSPFLRESIAPLMKTLSFSIIIGLLLLAFSSYRQPYPVMHQDGEHHGESH